MREVCFLLLHNYPIFKQLQLEEALLRSDDRNWCIINSDADPSIVMGISGKVELLLNQPLIREYPIPIIRRFSGGGTVVIDPNTVFVTWIFNTNDLGVPCCPQKILEWTGNVYGPLFGQFTIRENDYVFGGKKFGGNAQYLCKNRWLHHTSFLWDYDPKRMQYLLFPPKTPSYRKNRCHEEFLCTLKERMPCRKQFIQHLLRACSTPFQGVSIDVESAEKILSTPHRKATSLVSLEEIIK